jgi:hypothetical protein
MLELAAERVPNASPDDIWAVAADPTRFPERLAVSVPLVEPPDPR